MDILFFGSSDYSYECLKSLMDKYNIVGIITQPDKKGRKHSLEPTFLKQKMINSNIPIYQPENIKNEFELIKKINPDLILTAAYGQILPKEIIEFPKYKSVNIHASLLPKYKGASPIRQVILEGEEYTGLTSIYMDEKVDTGQIILQQKIKIDERETFSTLYNKFLKEIPEFTLKTIEAILNNRPSISQENICSYTNKVKSNDSIIDWNKSCIEIDRLIRAFANTPGASCTLRDRKFKIFKSEVIDIFHENKPGNLIRIDKNFIRIACGKGYIDIYELQIPGKRVIATKDFINGNKKWLNKLLEQNSTY